MTHYDPLTLDKQIRLLAEYVDLYQVLLQKDPKQADPGGPFIGIPTVTERATFEQLRELPEALPIRGPLLRWAYCLAEARVNAPQQRAFQLAWRSDPIALEVPQRITTTRAALMHRILIDSTVRNEWLRALSSQLDGAHTRVSELWQRREELAKRAGFSGVAAVIDPVSEFDAFIGVWLAGSKSSAVELLPSEPLELLDLALANRAQQGWPARISAQSMAALLGERAWLSFTAIREPIWPRLIGPTSFLWAFSRIGEALAPAWAQSTQPFVIAHDPLKLAEHRLGALLASLSLNTNWQTRILGLRKDNAEDQVRDLARSVLYGSRGLCLKVRLRSAAIESETSLKTAYAEHLIDIFGCELPHNFAGVLPRIALHDAQRLLGLWWGLSDHARLIQTFDEDWYRNPRAIEAVMGQTGDVAQLTPDTKSLKTALPEAQQWLTSCLGG